MRVVEFINGEYWPTIQTSLSPAWQRRTRDFLDMIVASLGEEDLASLSLQRVDHFMATLRRHYHTPVTPNKVAMRGRHVWKTAIRWKRATENPFADVRKEREPEHRFTPLTDAQHAQLLDGASEALRWYLMFARYTGARRSSLAKLEERDIDLTRNTITFRETKNGEDYTIPIHPTLRDWCQRAVTGQANRRALPQYRDVHTISSLFRRLRNRQNVKGFRFHDYRHNVGTQLAEKGYDVKVRMQMLGHKDSRMAMKYTHIAKETLEKALEDAL